VCGLLFPVPGPVGAGDARTHAPELTPRPRKSCCLLLLPLPLTAPAPPEIDAAPRAEAVSEKSISALETSLTDWDLQFSSQLCVAAANGYFFTTLFVHVRSTTPRFRCCDVLLRQQEMQNLQRNTSTYLPPPRSQQQVQPCTLKQLHTNTYLLNSALRLRIARFGLEAAPNAFFMITIDLDFWYSSRATMRSISFRSLACYVQLPAYVGVV
jgi:hypothetical protein